MISKTPIDNIDELLTRGVGEYIDPDGLFRAKLEKKIKGEHLRDIIIKFGVDPTRPDIHLGHAVIFRKLRTFQELGCKVVFIVGDFTAQIGDPTGKSKVRPEVEFQEVERNMQTYLDQVGKILLTDPKVFSWIRNSDWFYSVTDINLPDDYFASQGKALALTEHGKTVEDVASNSIIGKSIAYRDSRMQHKYGFGNIIVITLASFLWTLKHFTHAQLSKRDLFQERMIAGRDLYMHEMLYPIIQGIDSYALNIIYGSCDLEVGGTDQTFNMLIGRDVQERNRKMLIQMKAVTDLQAVLSFKLLVGTDGSLKMSKSLNNYIAINDDSNDMYGKIMSLPDDVIVEYFELCTYTPLYEIEKIAKELKNDSMNPRDIKKRLAREIVSIYHGEEKAAAAEEFFVNAFQKKLVPEDIAEVSAEKGSLFSDILIQEKIVESKSKLRRLLEGGAVSDMRGRKITDINLRIESDITLKIGKHRFLKIIIA